jgi:hypothetical protein
MEILWKQIMNIKIYPFAVNIPGTKPSEVSAISRFFGGFTAGVLLTPLSLVFWKLHKDRKTLGYFWLFTTSACFAVEGFTEALIEGFFPKYHGGIIETALIILILIPCILLNIGSISKQRTLGGA